MESSVALSTSSRSTILALISSSSSSVSKNACMVVVDFLALMSVGPPVLSCIVYHCLHSLEAVQSLVVVSPQSLKAVHSPHSLKAVHIHLSLGSSCGLVAYRASACHCDNC